jgi:hypothetical protein
MGGLKPPITSCVSRKFRLAELVRVPLYETVNADVTEEPVVNNLLSVTGHDTLYRSEVLRIYDGRGELHRDIRCIDVTGIEKALTLVSDDD